MEVRHGLVCVWAASKKYRGSIGKNNSQYSFLISKYFILKYRTWGGEMESQDDQGKIKCLVEKLSRQLIG